MSAANNLEALINLEKNLKSQYEEKLAAESQKVKELQEAQAALKATIDKQLVQITEMSSGRVEYKRLEQENRELSNRAGNQQKEIDTLKTRAKATQKELIEAKATIKTLKQLDAEKIKKNLLATKATLLEQREANQLLSKKNKTLKIENSELKNSNEELKKELATLKPEEENNDTDNSTTQLEQSEAKVEKQQSSSKKSPSTVEEEVLEAVAD